MTASSSGADRLKAELLSKLGKLRIGCPVCAEDRDDPAYVLLHIWPLIAAALPAPPVGDEARQPTVTAVWLRQNFIDTRKADVLVEIGGTWYCVIAGELVADTNPQLTYSHIVESVAFKERPEER